MVLDAFAEAILIAEAFLCFPLEKHDENGSVRDSIMSLFCWLLLWPRTRTRTSEMYV